MGSEAQTGIGVAMLSQGSLSGVRPNYGTPDVTVRDQPAKLALGIAQHQGAGSSLVQLSNGIRNGCLR